MMDGMMNGMCGPGGMMGCGVWILLWALLLVVLIALAVYGLVRLVQDGRGRRSGGSREEVPREGGA